ncbi:helix-turn-helix domain-containing protein [Streptomyces sp. ODS28]|uniref:helix-turn-helix domain-containing protein n=1 Tax=Streptomyces sp. ODS28 TaxID=3136688 RepID=UPI0031EFB765
MGVVRTPRAQWIEEGLRVLAAGGPEAVRIEALAQRLGVSKGGFYGYFRNREALIAEMLDTWEYEVTEGVIAEVEAEGGDERERLARLFAIAGLAEGPVTGPTADLAVRDWARRDETVARRLRRVDNRRMEYLRSLFSAFCPDPAEVEIRCVTAFSLRVGSHYIAADNGPYERDEVLRLFRERLLR